MKIYLTPPVGVRRWSLFITANDWVFQESTSLIFIIRFYVVRVSWTKEIDTALNITKDSAFTFNNPILHLSQFTPMYASLRFINIAILSIISKVLIYIVSQIFCFCEVIFGSGIILNHARDPTNIDKDYLFWIYCSIVAVETFPVCRVGDWLD